MVALVREDQGEFPFAAGEMFPGDTRHQPSSHREPFFSVETARNLLQELEGPPKGSPVPVDKDMPVASELKELLKSAANAVKRQRHSTIEPLHLLAAILEEQSNPLAELLANHGITGHRLASALETLNRREPESA